MSAVYRYSTTKAPFSFGSDYQVRMSANAQGNEDDENGDSDDDGVDLENLKAIRYSAAQRKLELSKQVRNNGRGQVPSASAATRKPSSASTAINDLDSAEDADFSNRSVMSPSLHAALRRKQQQQQQQQQVERVDRRSQNAPTVQNSQAAPRVYHYQDQQQQNQLVRSMNRLETTSDRETAPKQRSTPNASRHASRLNSSSNASSKASDRERSAASSFGSEDREYDEDTSFLNDKPAKEVFRIATNCLEASDEHWETQRRGLNLIRYLSRSNGALLQAEYRSVLPLILILTRNLRTQLSRVAIRTIGELFESLGRAIEADVERIVEQLLVRFADTNKFIQAELENCFNSFSNRIRADFAIPALLRIGAKHKSTIVRSRTAYIVLQILQNPQQSKVGSSTADVVRNYATSAVTDADPTVRRCGREIARVLGG